MHRIRATLRHALNMAMRQDRLIDFNPAAVLEMAAYTRPKPLVWTEDRVRAWQADYRSYRDGEKQRRGGRRVDPIDAYTSAPRPSPVMVDTRPDPACSSKKHDATACSPSISWSRCVDCDGARRAGCAGTRSISPATR
ncbi:hypothetical protein AB0C28_41810 [Nonomuraea sp. NPDC048892]|uniref:hypothetical protein n=1 Tax=Nonomuraea sp. NPDC048892 TaxID=3154624 RepID=UPI00340E2C45